MRGERQADDIAFAREAFDSLATRRLLVPALALALLLIAGKIALLSNLPTTANPDHLPYLLFFLLLMLGSMAFSVAILRILNGSIRPPWQPDSSLWLYGLAVIVMITVDVIADFLVGGRNDLPGGLAAAAFSTAVGAPLSPGLVAIAGEGSLEWRPAPWLRSIRQWLPPLLLWGLLIVAPLNQLHLMINQKYLVGGGEWFWPAAFFDGALGAAIALTAFALASTAYRRVARSKGLSS
jgi:hypothetical protein